MQFNTHTHTNTILSQTCSIDLTSEEPCSSSGAVSMEKTSDAQAPEAAEEPEEPEADGKLSLLTWNVDGLDTMNLAERARGLCSYLAL